MIFLHQRGVAPYLSYYERTDYGLLNRLNAARWLPDGDVVVETAHQRAAKDDADHGSRCWENRCPIAVVPINHEQLVQ